MIRKNEHDDHSWLLAESKRTAIFFWIFQNRLEHDVRQFDGHLVRAGETMFTQRLAAERLGIDRRTMQRRLDDLVARGYVQKVHICRVHPARNRGRESAPHKCAASEWRGYCVYFVAPQVFSAVVNRRPLDHCAPHRRASSLSLRRNKEGRRSAAGGRQGAGDPEAAAELVARHPELEDLLRRINQDG